MAARRARRSRSRSGSRRWGHLGPVGRPRGHRRRADSAPGHRANRRTHERAYLGTDIDLHRWLGVCFFAPGGARGSAALACRTTRGEGPDRRVSQRGRVVCGGDSGPRASGSCAAGGIDAGSAIRSCVGYQPIGRVGDPPAAPQRHLVAPPGRGCLIGVMDAGSSTRLHRVAGQPAAAGQPDRHDRDPAHNCCQPRRPGAIGQAWPARAPRPDTAHT